LKIVVYAFALFNSNFKPKHNDTKLEKLSMSKVIKLKTQL